MSSHARKLLPAEVLAHPSIATLVAAFLAAALAGASVAAAAFFAGAFLAAAEVAVRLLVAATARRLVASTWTEMPRPLRCTRSAFRCLGSTPASSLARRTSSGDTVPVGVPPATRAVMEGCVSTSAGSNLRACEDTNTSRETTSGRGEAR